MLKKLITSFYEGNIELWVCIDKGNILIQILKSPAKIAMTDLKSGIQKNRIRIIPFFIEIAIRLEQSEIL